MKIAIVGAKPDTWEKVPKLGPEWEIWRYSRRNFKKPPKADKWFELHRPKMMRQYENQLPGYTQFCVENNAITQATFPFQKLVDEFGPYFFSGGQAPWMMAYAIIMNPQTIGLWGIDPGGDYKPQRSEIQHFVTVALQRGIEVIAPEDTILEPRYPLYGLEMDRGPWLNGNNRGIRPVNKVSSAATI